MHFVLGLQRFFTNLESLMANITFSLGRSTYDNQPAQYTVADFDDFVTRIGRTGSTQKGQAYVCAALAAGQHPDTAKYPGAAHWRVRNLALPRRFLALDGCTSQ